MKRAPLRGLVVALAVLCAGTIAWVALLSRAAAGLTATDEIIANRSVPSIVAVQAIRADLQKQRALVDERLIGNREDLVVWTSRMDAVSRELEQHRKAYLALPRAPGEAAVRNALENSLARFESAVDRVRALPSGDNADASRVFQFDTIGGQLVSDSARATDFSADVAMASAADANRISQTLLPLTIALGIVCSAAIFVTILLTYRSVHQAEALAEKSRRALENKAEELDSFAGRVAHDLLSPLMTVGLGLDLAQRRAGAQEDARASVAISRASTTLLRVRGFVSDLLEFARAGARPPPGAHTPVDEVVREVAGEFEPIAQDSGVELRVESEPSHDVRCSPGVLTSLVSNLVQNAIKYVAESDVRRVVVRTRDLGGEVRVEVEDTGPGVPPSDQSQLFEPFVRGGAASRPGVGLGLATVRRLAEAHGGHVGVLSESGHGAIFWFSVPTLNDAFAR
jgi:signal transduction histidine kinase